jgi:hypothetical protein
MEWVDMSLVRELPYTHPYRWDGTLFGGPRLWRPNDLGSALALWLDAEDAASITLNGSTVSQWSDKSGNNRHATQPTAANQPTYNASNSILNGKPSIGATTNVGVVGVTCPSFTAREFFFVIAYRGGSDATFTSNYPTILSGPGSDGTQRAGMGLTVGSSSWFTTNTWASGSFVNGSETSTLTALPMPASIQRFSGSSAVNQAWSIGRNIISADRSWHGPIGEVIATTVVLSTDNRQKLEGYLAWKWALESSLPSGHPYKNRAPTQ